MGAVSMPVWVCKNRLRKCRLHKRDGMHDLNPFSLFPPDYDKLAKISTALEPFLIRRKTSSWASIRYSDPEALRQLSYTLLELYFSIKLDVPLDSLLPVVPGRVDYVLWCADLVKEYCQDEIWALDVGTGHSCIYSLLGTAVLPEYLTRTDSNWFTPHYQKDSVPSDEVDAKETDKKKVKVNFMATDLNERALEYARRNVVANQGADGVIEVVECNTIPIDEMRKKKQFLFSMCNPPFYDNEAEDGHFTQTRKRRKPSGVNTGSRNELIHNEGGDYGFVLEMIRVTSETQESRESCMWWTSLLGRKSSHDALVALMKNKQDSQIVRWKSARLQAGRTARWIFAWSFLPAPSQTPNFE
jgi:methyltransferase